MRMSIQVFSNGRKGGPEDMAYQQLQFASTWMPRHNLQSFAVV